MSSQEVFHLQLFSDLPESQSPILGGGFAPGPQPAWAFRFTALSLKVHALSSSSLPLPSLRSHPFLAQLDIESHPVLQGHEIFAAQAVQLIEPEQGLLISLCHRREASFIHILFLPETGRIRYLYETDHASRVWLSTPVYPAIPELSLGSTLSPPVHEDHPPLKPIQEPYYSLISLTEDGTLLYRRIPSAAFLMDHQRSSLPTIHPDSVVLGQLQEGEDATCVDIALGLDDSTVIVIGTSSGRAFMYLFSSPNYSDRGMTSKEKPFFSLHDLPYSSSQTSVSHIQLKPLPGSSHSRWVCAMGAAQSVDGVTRPLASLIHISMDPIRRQEDILMAMPEDVSTIDSSTEPILHPPLHQCTLRVLGHFLEEDQLSLDVEEETAPTMEFSNLSDAPLEVYAMSLGIASLKEPHTRERLFLVLTQNAAPSQVHILVLSPAVKEDDEADEDDRALDLLAHHVFPGSQQVWDEEGRSRPLLAIQGDPQSGECHILFPGSLALWSGFSDQIIAGSSGPNATPDTESEPQWLTTLTKVYPLGGKDGQSHAERIKQRRLLSPTFAQSSKGGDRVGLLLVDQLLGLLGVPVTMYPPKDVLSLDRLVHRILSSTLDHGRPMAVLYYLWLDAQAYGFTPGPTIERETAQWAKEIPHDFGEAIHAYWLMDQGREEEAVTRFTHLLPSPIDWVGHIWTQCYALSPSLAMRFGQCYGPGELPSDQNPQPLLNPGPYWVNRRVQALLGAGWIKDAYLMARQIDEADGQLMRSFFRWCLHGKSVVPGGVPKPRDTSSSLSPTRKRTWEGREGVPERLRTLMTLPLTEEEEITMMEECHRAVEGAGVSPEEAEVSGDFLIMYCIHRGRYVEAMWMDERIQRTQAILEDLRQPTGPNSLATSAQSPPSSSSSVGRDKRRRRKEAMLSGLREMLPTVSLMALRRMRESQGGEGSLQWEHLVERMAQYNSEQPEANKETEGELMGEAVLEEAQDEAMADDEARAETLKTSTKAKKAWFSDTEKKAGPRETGSGSPTTPVRSGSGEDHSGGSGQHSPFTRPPSIPKDSVVEDLRSKPPPSSPSKSPKVKGKKELSKSGGTKKSQKKSTGEKVKSDATVGKDTLMIDQADSSHPSQEEKAKVKPKKKAPAITSKDKGSKKKNDKDGVPVSSNEATETPKKKKNPASSTKKDKATPKKLPDDLPEDKSSQSHEHILSKGEPEEFGKERNEIKTPGKSAKKGRRKSVEMTEVTRSPLRSPVKSMEKTKEEDEMDVSTETPLTPSSVPAKAGGKRATTRSMTRKD
ncbi:nuclear pore complex assembly-domain-containing protein [Piptocephalis cylindrospora]|uniref:Nuclear pore complex assembly-domain-containing protein n=1 Tax=Piptocephalis cylindrospora TaxID=1907219 RepID=A0A4V1IYN0_9FUNG|nr:nuclear pore complex assembly-domain-containing protein [Piptocephalis cylindrospora]|eukprot:RKP15129.1 nuclear pore complex assembly-domain-containing protein [Piptocephalis cylindrospora]